jgi:hypothetical protein
MSRTIPPREAKQDSSAGLRAWLGRARQQWLSGRSAGLRLRFAFLGGTLGLIVLLLVSISARAMRASCVKSKSPPRAA